MTDTVYQWVNNDQQLAELCEHWSQQLAIAIDTEFMRSRTFYPRLGLVQIADARGVYLIDPLAIEDKTAFAQLLANPAVVKVIHSCSEDLDVLHYFFGTYPTNLFDTQLAAAFAGFGSSIGYANLLKAVLGIEIPKHETRSDWLQRPLSDAQMRYAALDVKYLLAIYVKLHSQLEQQQRLAWVEEDCLALLNKAFQSQLMENYYLRIRSLWKLEPIQLATLQRLSLWREQQARARDVPRNRLLKENLLWEIAAKRPKSLSQLKKVRELPHQTVVEYGNTLLQLIEEVGSEDSSNYPKRMPRPLTLKQGEHLKSLKETVAGIAQALELPAEVLIRKKDYEQLVRMKPACGCQNLLPPGLRGWREEVVGLPLLERLCELQSS